MNKISTTDAAFTLARLCLGPGLLVLPYATLKGGLIFAPIGILLVALWFVIIHSIHDVISAYITIFLHVTCFVCVHRNGFSCIVMIQCRHASEKVTNDNNIKIPSTITSTFSRVAYIGLGHIGTFLADFSVIITLLGVCCSYQINFGTLTINIFSINRYASVDGIIVFSSILVSPFIFIDDLSILSSMSSIGLFCVVLSAVVVLIYGYILYGGDQSNLTSNPTPITAYTTQYTSSTTATAKTISTKLSHSYITNQLEPLHTGKYNRYTTKNALLHTIGYSRYTTTGEPLHTGTVTGEYSRYSEGYDILHYFPLNISEGSSYFGIAIFCFGICAYAFPIHENMLYTNEFSKAIIYALLLVCCIYILLGVYGAILYNHSEYGIQGNILLNLPVHTAAGVIVRLSMALVS